MGRKPISGKCKYCGMPSLLQWSHAIPRSYFKPLMQDGKILSVHSNSYKVSTTNNSGADHLLCRVCEEGFNDEFEKVVDNDLKRAEGRILASFLPLEDKMDNSRLIRFIAACLWRCSISRNDMWHSLRADENLRSIWSEIIFGDLDIFCQYASFGIRKITDKQAGGMNKALSKVLLPPRHLYRDTSRKDQFSTSFAILGFLLEFHVPAVPFHERGKYGVLVPGRDRVTIPHVYFLDHQITHSAAMEAMRKDVNDAYSASARAFLKKGRM